jgi:hypothetical protein
MLSSLQLACYIKGKHMSEKPIMWIGKQPGQKKQAPNPEKDEALAENLSKICEAAGYKVDGFLAAQGNYGSWLVRMSGQGKDFQLIWDGKQGQLRQNVAIPNGGWDELASHAVEDKNTEGLIAGAAHLLMVMDA